LYRTSFSLDRSAAPMRNVDWIVIALTVGYVLVATFALWVGLWH
jgi:hypothetical protein